MDFEVVFKLNVWDLFFGLTYRIFVAADLDEVRTSIHPIPEFASEAFTNSLIPLFDFAPTGRTLTEPAVVDDATAVALVSAGGVMSRMMSSVKVVVFPVDFTKRT